ncbi:hypothetical protein RRG08_058482 [Elysia crispata]|uniref:Uncharacterized protein n=1 Tax=Elysia crispata TaxID=231223 RepID=A0AAE1CTF0_9GAST|nr:hypothetical protein RRG08_058482 [Elysia crispata]
MSDAAVVLGISRSCVLLLLLHSAESKSSDDLLKAWKTAIKTAIIVLNIDQGNVLIRHKLSRFPPETSLEQPTIYSQNWATGGRPPQGVQTRAGTVWWYGLLFGRFRS